MPDIDVGQFSEALNDKMDRDGNNRSSSAFENIAHNSGVDFVVEYKMPTVEGPTWYRLYASGWVEQGGCNSSGATRPVIQNLPIRMLNTNYTITHADCQDSTYSNMYITWFYNKTAESFTYYFNGGGSVTIANYVLNWEVKGMSLQEQS